MDGPSHYREAEQLLADCNFNTARDAERIAREDGYGPDAQYLAAAHVHATLALAAATALSTADWDHTEGRFACMPGPDVAEWVEVSAVDEP